MNTSPTDKLVRPRQVTVAGWLIMVGSLIVLATVFERISGLNSIDTRAGVEKFLSEPPGDGLGLGVDGVLTIIRTLAMVAAGCATASAILGYHVLRRSRSARLGLTIVAVPLFLAGMATGGFMSSVVVAAAVMLWFQPARDWFDGVNRTRVEAAERGESPPRAQQPGPPPPSQPYSGPRPFPGFGSPPPTPGAPYELTDNRRLVPPVPADPATRPGAVVWACALTWACCGLAVVGLLLSVVMVATAPNLIFDEVYRRNPDYADQGLTRDALTTAIYVTAGICIVWSVVATVLAALVYRRVPWARRALLVSASVAALVCLAATVTNFLLVLPLTAVIATIVLLARPDSRAWLSGGRPPGPRGSVRP
ncbi:MAG: hypothetical protein JWO11_345 [Nocardioides sp.]|nr:hypothetical protein [Nocardioides sp.]